MSEIERILAHYGCDRFCYNNNDCNNCWFKQHVQYELDRLKSQHPVCKSETKNNGDYKIIIYRAEDIESIFPELKEPEDDRIRKALLRGFKNYRIYYDTFGKADVNSIIAWLEKQKEPELSEDLGDYIAELSKQFPEVSFAKLSRIAVRVKNWLEKQGEQKPTDKTEPFDKYEGLTDFERTLADICIGWIGKEIGWKEYIKDNSDILLKIAIEKFNSVQDASFEQKPAWSEEDEKMLEGIVNTVKDARCQSLLSEIEIYDDYIDWLESIKQRHTWKPSEEQIIALEYIINNARNTSYSCKIAKELLEQLKKLKV